VEQIEFRVMTGDVVGIYRLMLRHDLQVIVRGGRSEELERRTGRSSAELEQMATTQPTPTSDRGFRGWDASATPKQGQEPPPPQSAAYTPAGPYPTSRHR